jgi:exopolyphosphatase/guanosine-5'-triphosphate,3'-diphosphate pyrophosphatase
MNNPAFAAIDIGSNTFRLLIATQANQYDNTPWNTLVYTHRIIRLGEGLHEHGKLCEAAMQRALTAFCEFSEILKQYHIPSEHTFAVATAAMREASNGEVFCKRVLDKTNIHIHIIDGKEEAHMSLLGVCSVLNHHKQSDMLLFDIGGGSTEFVRASQTQTIDAISCKLGVVRLVEAYLHSNPPSTTDYQSMKNTCHQHLDQVEKHWAAHTHTSPPKHVIGTAGTITTLAAIDLNMGEYNADIVNNHCISQQRFYQLRDKLLNMDLKERQSLASIEAGRADLMVAGLAIIESIFEHWQYQELTVVDAGLLEGAWLKIAHAN